MRILGHWQDAVASDWAAMDKHSHAVWKFVPCLAPYPSKQWLTAGVIARMDEDSQAFTREIDSLNKFLKARNIPQPLRVKLREYVHFRWSEKRARGAEVADVLQSMSSDLAAQVYTVTHVPILQQLHCFTSTSVEFLAALCSKFQVNLFSPEDMIIKCETMTMS